MFCKTRALPERLAVCVQKSKKVAKKSKTQKKIFFKTFGPVLIDPRVRRDTIDMQDTRSFSRHSFRCHSTEETSETTTQKSNQPTREVVKDPRRKGKT
jgi:hypothetical protein